MPVENAPSNPRDKEKWLSGEWDAESDNRWPYFYCLSGTESFVSIARKLSGKPVGGTGQRVYKKGLTWKTLCKENYGTAKPAEINYYLATFNGCTRTDKSGSNYMLSSDDPNPWLWVPLEEQQVGGKSGVRVPVTIPAKPEIPAAASFTKIRWHLDDRTREVYSRSVSDQIVAVPYYEGAEVYMELELARDATVPARAPIELAIAPDGKDFVRHEFAVHAQDARTVTVRVTFDDLKAVVEATDSGINQAFFRCAVPKELAETGDRIVSENLSYPIVQYALFFLPGVLGSEISVVNHKGKVEEAFPEVGRFGDIELELLVCNPDGSPKRDPVPDRLRILSSVFHPWVAEVYDVRDRVEDLREKAFPEVFVDAGHTARVQHVLYEEVPYDWRANIQESHQTIAREILDRFTGLAGENPFLAPKVSIAGHSTGGVIMRGIATSNNALKDKVEHMFFINVPHWGAPKAEYVFLVGDMGVPIVKTESFRQLAPDLPIVYFLSPNKRYGSEVSANWSPAARQSRVQAAISAGAYDTEKKKLYGYPAYAQEGPLRFNRGLANQAERYSASTQNKSPAVKAFVFHSGSHRTIVGTRLDGDEVVGQMAPVGDGTVPTISQIADIGSWKGSVLFRATPENPLHVPAPNSRWIWRQVMRVFAGEDVSNATIPWPRNQRQLRRLLIDIARDEWSGKDTKDIAGSTFSLTNVGQTRTHTQANVDVGLMLLECLSGAIEVTCSARAKKNWNTFSTVTLTAGGYDYEEFIEQHSTYDQENRVQVKALSSKAEYRIDFVSSDL